MTPLTPRALRLLAAFERADPFQMAIQPTNAGGANKVATIPAVLQDCPRPREMLAEGAVFTRAVGWDSRA